MTLHEAFANLIKKRGWYKNSGILQPNAIRDKQYFLIGKTISEERIRQYLRAADWEQTQEEQWTEKDGK